MGEEPYCFAHLSCSNGKTVKIPKEEKLNVVVASEVSGYNILDWFKVIQNAQRIYCTESSFQAFIDGASRFIKSDRFILPIHHRHTTNHKTSESYWDKRYLL